MRARESKTPSGLLGLAPIKAALLLAQTDRTNTAAMRRSFWRVNSDMFASSGEPAAGEGGGAAARGDRGAAGEGETRRRGEEAKSATEGERWGEAEAGKSAKGEGERRGEDAMSGAGCSAARGRGRLVWKREVSKTEMRTQV